MSVFDKDNITKEGPLDKAYKYVDEIIQLHFYSIINDTGWDATRTSQIFTNIFKRRSEWFESLGLTVPLVKIESYSLRYWDVVVYINEQHYNIELYHEYLERKWEDVNHLNTELTTFKDNL